MVLECIFFNLISNGDKIIQGKFASGFKISRVFLPPGTIFFGHFFSGLGVSPGLRHRGVREVIQCPALRVRCLLFVRLFPISILSRIFKESVTLNSSYSSKHTPLVKPLGTPSTLILNEDVTPSLKLHHFIVSINVIMRSIRNIVGLSFLLSAYIKIKPLQCDGKNMQYDSFETVWNFRKCCTSFPAYL